MGYNFGSGSFWRRAVKEVTMQGCLRLVVAAEGGCDGSDGDDEEDENHACTNRFCESQCFGRDSRESQYQGEEE